MTSLVSKLTAGVYFFLALVFLYGAVRDAFFLLFFIPILILVSFGVLGKGGRFVRILSYVVGVVVLLFYSYYAFNALFLAELESTTVALFAIYFCAIIFGALTIYCVRKNANSP